MKILVQATQEEFFWRGYVQDFADLEQRVRRLSAMGCTLFELRVEK